MSNADPLGKVAAYGDRLWRLQEEQRALGEDIRELKKEAKAAEISVRDITLYARLKKQGEEKTKENNEVMDRVLQLLGWLD